MKKRITVPNDLSSGERQLVARKVIERIQDRTDAGRDVNNVKFPSYSDEYADSLEFKIAGKSKGNVNLQQSGDTIHSIELLDHGSGFISIGFEGGSEENDKGTWLEASDNGVSRKFLGINDDDLRTIVNKVKKQRTDSKARNRELVTESAVSSILKRLGF